MTVKLLIEHNLEFLSLKRRLHRPVYVYVYVYVHLSECHIFGNHMSRLNYDIGEQRRLMRLRIAQTIQSLRCSHIRCMVVDEGSDQNLDFKPRLKRQHMRLLDALAHMRISCAGPFFLVVM